MCGGISIYLALSWNSHVEGYKYLMKRFLLFEYSLHRPQGSPTDKNSKICVSQPWNVCGRPHILMLISLFICSNVREFLNLFLQLLSMATTVSGVWCHWVFCCTCSHNALVFILLRNLYHKFYPILESVKTEQIDLIVIAIALEQLTPPNASLITSKYM